VPNGGKGGGKHAPRGGRAAGGGEEGGGGGAGGVLHKNTGGGKARKPPPPPPRAARVSGMIRPNRPGRLLSPPRARPHRTNEQECDVELSAACCGIVIHIMN